MLRTISADDVDDAIEAETFRHRGRCPVLVEAVGVEDHIDQFGLFEFQLDDAGVGSDRGARMPDEVAEGEHRHLAIGELDRLKYMRVMADDRSSTGVKQFFREGDVRRGGACSAFGTPVKGDHHDIELLRCDPDIRDHPVTIVSVSNTGTAR